VTGSNAVCSIPATPVPVLPVIAAEPEPVEDESDGCYSFDDVDDSDDDAAKPRSLRFTPKMSRSKVADEPAKITSKRACSKRPAESQGTASKRVRHSGASSIGEQLKVMNEIAITECELMKDVVTSKAKDRDYLKEGLEIRQAESAKDVSIANIIIDAVDVLQDPTKAKTFVLLQGDLRFQWLKSCIFRQN
jgi:hypothetical protein